MSVPGRSRFAVTATTTLSPETVSGFETVGGDWLCWSRWCWRLPHAIARGVRRILDWLTVHASTLVVAERWWRYYVDLHAALPAAPPEVHLTPVTDELVADLRRRPDGDANQLQSGFRFWEHGLRGAFIWLGADGPYCLQWLLTARDNALLRTLPVWAGIYPTLADDGGAVENLYGFGRVHRGAPAPCTLFEYALYHHAKSLGLATLLTHISVENAAAQRWAQRTGWSVFGEIARYRIDLRGLRHFHLYLHTT